MDQLLCWQVLFSNVLDGPRLAFDPRSVHESLPVISGVKLAATVCMAVYFICQNSETFLGPETRFWSQKYSQPMDNYVISEFISCTRKKDT